MNFWFWKYLYHLATLFLRGVFVSNSFVVQQKSLLYVCVRQLYGNFVVDTTKKFSCATKITNTSMYLRKNILFVCKKNFWVMLTYVACMYGATFFFRMSSCRMHYFRPSVYRKWTIYQISDLPLVRQDKFSNVYMSELHIADKINVRKPYLRTDKFQNNYNIITVIKISFLCVKKL
jgi:hypothetical protein